MIENDTGMSAWIIHSTWTVSHKRGWRTIIDVKL